MDAVVVGVVVAGVNAVVEVVLERGDEAVVDVDPDALGVVVVSDVAVVAAVTVPCDVWPDARLANRATPPTEAAATDTVIRRVRRRIEPREAEAEEVMDPVSAIRLGGS